VKTGKDAIVHCIDETMERQRNALLRGIFEDSNNESNNEDAAHNNDIDSEVLNGNDLDLSNALRADDL